MLQALRQMANAQLLHHSTRQLSVSRSSLVGAKVQTPVVRRTTGVRQFHCTRATYAQAPPAQYQQVAPLTKRTFAGITLYKGKAAVAFKVIKPTWTQTGDASYAIKRDGVLLLEFAPVQAGSSSGVGDRRYDWDNKQTIALSHWELGHFLAQKEGEPLPRMFHDPNMGSNLSGSVTKELTFIPMANSNPPAYFLNLTVTEKAGQPKKLGCPVSLGELATIKNIMQFILPHITGFDAVLQDEQEVFSDYSAAIPQEPAPF